MPAKPQSYCGKCRKIHRNEECPHRVAFGRANTQLKSGRGGSKWRTKRERIFIRDGFLCQIHKEKGQIVSVELHGVNHGVCDHIVATKHGGSDDDENLQTICQACDAEKTQFESTKLKSIE